MSAESVSGYFLTVVIRLTDWQVNGSARSQRSLCRAISAKVCLRFRCTAFHLKLACSIFFAVESIFPYRLNAQLSGWRFISEYCSALVSRFTIADLESPTLPPMKQLNIGGVRATSGGAGSRSSVRLESADRADGAVRCSGWRDSAAGVEHQQLSWANSSGSAAALGWGEAAGCRQQQGCSLTVLKTSSDPVSVACHRPLLCFPLDLLVMTARCSLRDAMRIAAALCCLAAVTAAGQSDNQGIYRRCSDGRSVAVPCLQPTTDCTDRSVPSRIPGSCVRWYSCCKAPPKDVNYVRSPEKKAARREQIYEKAFSWLVAGARAVKKAWNSLLSRVRGEAGSEEQSPYANLGPRGADAYNWRRPAYGENHPSRSLQYPSSQYGPPNSKRHTNPQISNWVADADGVSGRYKLPGGRGPSRRDRGLFGRPSGSPDGFTRAPSGPTFSSRPKTPAQFDPSRSSFSDSAAERPSLPTPTPTPLEGADAVVAEAARRWLPSDCGRLSPIRTPTEMDRRRRKRDVTGGHPADRSRWTWMAIVGMRQPEQNWAENRGQGPVWICGGAVITPRFVLTAAHCVGGRALDSLVVRLGEYNLSSATDGPHQDRLVSSVTLHPQFVSRQNDVALLRLNRPAELGLTVRPVCLPVPGTPPVPARLRRVAGWGKLSFEGAGAAALQEAKLTLVPPEACEAIYRRLSSFSESFPGGGFLGTKLCAVDPSPRGADACQGDSGGPLTGRRTDGRFSLVGVVSLGVGCGDPDFPGVYTRVESYVPWIVAVIATTEVEAGLSAA